MTQKPQQNRESRPKDDPASAPESGDKQPEKE